MGDFVELPKAGELQDGTMKKVNVAGREVLLARAGGKYYCVDSRCPHMGGDLSRGILSGTTLECPLHHSRFELSDGHVIRWLGSGLASGILGHLKGPVPLKTYEVMADGDRILIKL